MGHQDGDPVEERQVVAQVRPYGHPGPGIERGQGFVEQQHARRRGQSPRERDPLGLATGELAGLELGLPLEAEPGEKGVG